MGYDLSQGEVLCSLILYPFCKKFLWQWVPGFGACLRVSNLGWGVREGNIATASLSFRATLAFPFLVFLDNCKCPSHVFCMFFACFLHVFWFFSICVRLISVFHYFFFFWVDARSSISRLLTPSLLCLFSLSWSLSEAVILDHLPLLGHANGYCLPWSYTVFLLLTPITPHGHMSSLPFLELALTNTFSKASFPPQAGLNCCTPLLSADLYTTYNLPAYSSLFSCSLSARY